MGIAQTDRKSETFYFGCKIEHAEHLHPIGRYRVLVVDDSDVAEAEGFDQGLDDLVMRDSHYGALTHSRSWLFSSW
jgi:hypothetical protein